MGRILTEEMVKRAIEMVRPSAEAILNAEGTTWGPKWVEGWVDGPGLAAKVGLKFGEITAWKDEWGVFLSFNPVAHKKGITSAREMLPTSVITHEKPWLLEVDEYLYPGGTTRDGITVAVSGAKGRVDEAIAEMVLFAIRMLAFLETERRIQEKQMKI